MRKEFESPERFTAQLAEVGGFLSRACSFTGHRPQKFPWRYNESDPACVALKETLADQITQLYETGYTEFLTGMALGVDLWAAQIVLDLRRKKRGLPGLRFAVHDVQHIHRAIADVGDQIQPFELGGERRNRRVALRIDLHAGNMDAVRRFAPRRRPAAGSSHPNSCSSRFAQAVGQA